MCIVVYIYYKEAAKLGSILASQTGLSSIFCASKLQLLMPNSSFYHDVKKLCKICFLAHKNRTYMKIMTVMQGQLLHRI